MSGAVGYRMASGSALNTRPVITSVRSLASKVGGMGGVNVHRYVHRYHSFSGRPQPPQPQPPPLAPPPLSPMVSRTAAGGPLWTKCSSLQSASSEVLKRLLESGCKDDGTGVESGVWSVSGNLSTVASSYASKQQMVSAPNGERDACVLTVAPLPQNMPTVVRPAPTPTPTGGRVSNQTSEEGKRGRWEVGGNAMVINATISSLSTNSLRRRVLPNLETTETLSMGSVGATELINPMASLNVSGGTG